MSLAPEKARNLRSIAFLIIGAILACSLGSLGYARNDKIFNSRRYHYGARYPSGWYLDPTRIGDILDIISFPPSKAVHAVYLPSGGAEITLVPQEAVDQNHHPRTLQGWIDSDMKRRTGAAKRDLEIDGPFGKLRITEIKRQHCAVAPCLQSINWYFQFEGRLFVATLSYWAGNPRADKLIQALNGIVRSLAVISD